MPYTTATTITAVNANGISIIYIGLGIDHLPLSLSFTTKSVITSVVFRLFPAEIITVGCGVGLFVICVSVDGRNELSQISESKYHCESKMCHNNSVEY